jgi:hypothetical protein
MDSVARLLPTRNEHATIGVAKMLRARDGGVRANESVGKAMRASTRLVFLPPYSAECGLTVISGHSAGELL